MRDSFHMFWFILPLLLSAGICAGAFLRSHIRKKRLQRSARQQLFYRACRKYAIIGSEDLLSESQYHIAGRLAQECGLSCSSREALGRILDAEKPAYEARRQIPPT